MSRQLVMRGEGLLLLHSFDAWQLVTAVELLWRSVLSLAVAFGSGPVMVCLWGHLVRVMVCQVG